jgi:uncharacterized membrane protein
MSDYGLEGASIFNQTIGFWCRSNANISEDVEDMVMWLVKGLWVSVGLLSLITLIGFARYIQQANSNPHHIEHKQRFHSLSYRPTTTQL